MTVFYTGYRNILRGRDADNFVHTYKNTVGVYSNWSLMDTGAKVLAGMPNTEYSLGDKSQASILEYIYSGGQHIAPAGNAGAGPRVTGARFEPFTYRGLAGAAVFAAAGHAANRGVSYEFYNIFAFDGVPSADPLSGVGHAVRYSTSYGGASKPNENQGITPQALASSGHTSAAEKPLEWKGVPASRVL